MASLLARHQKTCETGRPWSRVDYTVRSFNPEKEKLGCTSKPGPMFYVVASANSTGGRRSVGRNFAVAKEHLTKIQGGLDWGEEDALTDATFAELTEEWLRWLRAKPTAPEENTLRSYVATIDYGKEAFNGLPVRKLTVREVERCLSFMARTLRGEDGEERREPISAATRLKHFRVLSAIFNFAVRGRYAASSPVTDLELRPSKEKAAAPYCTDENLLLGVGSLVAGTLLVVFAWDAQAKRNSGSSS
jgi:hypothetical protein